MSSTTSRLSGCVMASIADRTKRHAPGSPGVDASDPWADNTWENFTRQSISTEKWDCVPRPAPLQFRHEHYSEEEAGFAPADCRGKSARAAGAAAAAVGPALHSWRH